MEEKEDKEKVTKEQFISQCKIEDTCILDYLDVVKNEYIIERNKRQSFETRAGVVIAFLAVLCIFAFEKVKIADLYMSMFQTLNLFILLKILSGIGAYLGIFIALLFSIKTIQIKEFNNFEVAQFKESVYGQPRIQGNIELIKAYCKIINQHRLVNEKNAKYLKKALYCVIVTVASLAIYLAYNKGG